MWVAFGVFGATAVVFTGAVAVGILLTVRYPDTAHQTPGHLAHVVVAKGMVFPDISETLKQADVIGSTSAFRIYAGWRGLAHRIRAGTYELRTDMTPRQVLAKLVQGSSEPEATVTIPEGKNIVEVAELLATAGIGSRVELLQLMRNATFVHTLGSSADTLEGMLFPDTYRLRLNAPEAALRVLYARFREVMDDLFRRYPAAMEALKKDGFGETQVVTLASIVEKETGQQDERPLVASVYLNRLRLTSFQPKLLEADPTITYGCTALVQPSEACRRLRDRIRTAQLRDRENPYNTYVHPGLPPGPIANPGRAALEAVLNSASTSYLYFVSRNDGTHEFSSTPAAHARAVEHFQRQP